MTLVLSLVAMTVVAVALAVVPLLRNHKSVARRDFDLAVYRDQLAELEREHARGVIDDDQTKAAKLEIERRILAAADADAEADGASRASHLATTLTPTALALAVPLLAALVYLAVGSPQLPDQPQVARPSAPEADPQSDDLVARAEQLEQHIETTPDNQVVWLALARTRMRLGQPTEAVEAFRESLALKSDDPSVEAELGEALVYLAGGVVTPEAIEHLKKALEGQPDEPRGRYYLGLALAQEGETDAAFDIWRELLATTPSDAPWRAQVVDSINSLAEQLGRDPGELLADLPTTEPTTEAGAGAMPQPNAEDRAQMAALSPDERTDRIRTMVDGLAARLEEEPGDVDGWLRLGRSRAVLGEAEAAKEAYQQALQRMGPDHPEYAAVQDQIAALGNPSAAAPAAEPSAPPQPAEQPAEMSPTERNEQIRGMVDGLAARLEDQPDDVEGWVMLGRSRMVLGEPEAAQEAYERALELDPQSPDVLKSYAASLLGPVEQTGQDPAVGEQAADLYQRAAAVAPDDPEPHWYLGLAAAQSGAKDQAAQHWRQLLELLEADHPERNFFETRLAELEAATSAPARSGD